MIYLDFHFWLDPQHPIHLSNNHTRIYIHTHILLQVSRTSWTTLSPSKHPFFSLSLPPQSKTHHGHIHCSISKPKLSPMATLSITSHFSSISQQQHKPSLPPLTKNPLRTKTHLSRKPLRLFSAKAQLDNDPRSTQVSEKQSETETEAEKKSSDEEEEEEIEQEKDWKTDEEFKSFMGNPSIEAAIKLEKKRADRKLKELDRESRSDNPILALFNRAARESLEREKERLEKVEQSFIALDLNKVTLFCIFFFQTTMFST